MNTQQLECFICVADKLNFLKAAEELFLSTPTVTHHIKNLEEELGTKLFIRNSRVVKLTNMGRVFYGDAKEILNRVYLSKKKIVGIKSENISFLKLACSSYLELENLEGILKIMQKNLPNVYPKILVKNYSIIRTLFKGGNIDMAFVTKEMIKGIDCKFKLIKNINTYAIFSDDYEIDGVDIKNKDSISFDDLKSSCLITLNSKFIPFKQGNMLQENLTLHSEYGFNIVCESDIEAIQLTKAGYGIAILPETSIPNDIEGLSMKLISEQISSDYGIAYPKDTDNERVRYFVENIDSTL